jgi:hypothetical protein
MGCNRTDDFSRLLAIKSLDFSRIAMNAITSQGLQ